MIYAVVGGDAKKREIAFSELAKKGESKNHIYGEQIDQLEPIINAVSLFGDTVVVTLVQTMDNASSKEEVTRLLQDMKESSNIFIIDEPFADANRVSRLTKYAEKVYDAREEKVKDVDVFTLCNYFAKRDKKNAWLEWMKLRDSGSKEAVAGALWWKFQIVWQDAKAGKVTKFTQEECEKIGGDLVKASIRAHRGELDLGLELERIILSL